MERFDSHGGNNEKNSRDKFFGSRLGNLSARREYHLDKARDKMAPISFKAARESASPVAHLDHIALPVAEPKKVEGVFRRAVLCVPGEIDACCGISVFGRVIKSFVFSTDVVTIRNCNADAVLAVYPFTCQPAITQALIAAAECPVFTGIAGSVTYGQRAVDLAHFSEMQGASGVVLNSTAEPETIRAVAAYVDIPVIVTVTEFDEYAQVRIAAGAQIVNVAAGHRTAEVVRQVRRAFPVIPIMASGGKNAESITATIAAGADAISWTPPNMADLEHQLMDSNRAALEAPDAEEDQPA